jgi:hypothetical protein
MTEPRSYYGQPVIKEPVWTWEIPLYFFTGGMAGASAGLALLSEIRGNDVLARRAWAASFGAVGISPVLLISDLGKPTRFLNMLRMFKVTSPMSVGSWILVGSGTSTALAATNAWTGWFPRLGRVAKPVAAVLGLPLSTYTAALVANTAVPVWHEARWELPFVFGSGAALSAGAAAVIATPVTHAAPARRLALAAGALELISSQVMERRLGPLGEPYSEGLPSRLKLATGAGVLAGSALMRWRGRRSRPIAAVGGALMMAGAAAARWNVFRAGFASVRDPAYTVAPQRARVDAKRTHAEPAARTDTALPGEPVVEVGSPANSDRQ